MLVRKLTVTSLANLLTCVLALAAGAQLSQPTMTTTSSTLAILTFRGGLKAAPMAIPNPGASPLASVGLTWPAYPNASGYRVIGALMNSSGGPMTPFTVLTSSDLGASVSGFTATRLPPGTSVGFRVVALVSGAPKDTTTLIAATTAAYTPQTDWSTIAAVWPAPTSGGLGIVYARRCASLSFTYNTNNMTASSTWTLAWARNPAASSYSTALVHVYNGTIRDGNLSPETPRTMTDTSATFGVGVGRWGVFVRPEFAPVPMAGASTVHGAWSYFGMINSLPPMQIYPCTPT